MPVTMQFSTRSINLGTARRFMEVPVNQIFLVLAAGGSASLFGHLLQRSSGTLEEVPSRSITGTLVILRPLSCKESRFCGDQARTTSRQRLLRLQ
jgi:hypothetical protein